jgi:hypothetical protein
MRTRAAAPVPAPAGGGGGHGGQRVEQARREPLLPV